MNTLRITERASARILDLLKITDPTDRQHYGVQIDCIILDAMNEQMVEVHKVVDKAMVKT